MEEKYGAQNIIGIIGPVGFVVKVICT